MVQEILRPGVKDCRDSQGRIEVVATEFQQSRRGTGEQERVEPTLIVLDQPVELMRQREDDVEVRDGQQVLNLLLQPLGTLELLTARTVPVATGVGHEVLLPAMGTLVLVATERRGVTGAEGPKHFPVMIRQAMGLGKVGQRG